MADTVGDLNDIGRERGLVPVGNEPQDEMDDELVRVKTYPLFQLIQCFPPQVSAAASYPSVFAIYHVKFALISADDPRYAPTRMALALVYSRRFEISKDPQGDN